MEVPTRMSLESNPDYKRIEPKTVTASGSIWTSTFPAPKMCWDEKELEKPSKVELKEGDIYAVKEDSWDYWYRGKIKCSIDDKVEVFMVDNGNTLWIERKNVRLLSDYSKKILPQIFQVNFHGIRPLFATFDEKAKFIKVPTDRWSTGAVESIEKKIKASKATYFKEIETVNVGKFDNTKTVKFGIIYIDYRNEMVCLNDILCAEGFAIKVETFNGVAEQLTRSLVGRGIEKEISKAKNFSKEKKIGEEKKIHAKRIMDKGEEAKMEKNIHTEKINEMKKKTENIDNHQYVPHSIDNAASSSNKSTSFFENINGLGLYKPFTYLSRYVERFSETKFVNKNVSDEINDASAAEETAYESSTQIASGSTSSNRFNSDSESESTCRSDIEIETRKHEQRVVKETGNNRFSSFNVMIHSSPDIVEPIEPISFLIESQICLRIKSILEEKRRPDLTPIQKHVLPILFKRHNAVIVGNRSGKTLSSVVAILSLLRQPEYYSSLMHDHAPKAIHMCAYSYKVRNVFKMYQELIRDKDIIVKMACGGTGVEAKGKKVLEGCDILVATPACLVRVLTNSHMTNLNRLCHIVYDDADTIFDVFLDEIKKLAGSIKALEEARKDFKVQKIVISQTWLPKLKHFIKNMICSGFICVSNNSQLEAAIYSNLKPHFSFLDPEHKAEYLMNLLLTHTSPARILVACNNKDEVFDLEKKLDLPNIRIFIAHEGMTPIEVSYVKKSWAETMTMLNPVMICTDSKELILSELDITDCTWLIHYNIPGSKTIFSNRFGCLVDSFNNLFLDDKKEIQPRINIFVDETNDEQFPMIVDLMKRLKINVDPTIERVVKRINRKKELDKRHSPVCDQLREFGECYERKKCKFRHIFLKSVDDYEKSTLPRSRFVKFRILNVHSVSHFTAQILEYKVGSQWMKIPNVRLLELISMKMDLYFSETSNRFTYPNPALGDLVAVEPEEDGVFCRGKVITILQRDQKKNPRVVRVKLVDLGSIMEFNVLKLYDLPNDLKEYEGQAIDVFLCKLKPADKDCAWDLEASDYVKTWVRKVQEAIRINGKNQYLFGQVNTSAGYTLWMDRITHCEWLEQTKTEMHTSLGVELVQRKMAFPNPDHMNIIRNLCTQANLNITVNEPKEEEKECLVKENTQQWAHLPRDEFSSVEVILAENPDLMFIRNTKFKDRLDMLTKDLSEARIWRLQEGGAVLAVGDNCLAFSNGSWNRAKVMQLKSDTEVEVFFVDHAVFRTVGWNDLAKIPDTFVNRLLFQAMECRLVGVVSPNGQWSEYIDEAINEMTKSEGMSCKTLQAYVVDLELKATVTGGRKYSVVLIDTNSNPFVVINEELCRGGLAELHLDDDQLFEDIVSRCKVNPDTDEESEDDFLNEPESHGFFDLNMNTNINTNTNINSNTLINGEVEFENNNTTEDYSNSTNQQTWSDVRWDGDKVIPVEEPESIPGPFQTILENFEEYEEDLFNLLGLNRYQVLKTIYPELEYEAVNHPKNKEIHNTSDVDGDVSDVEDKCSPKTKVRTKHKQKRRESEGEKKSIYNDNDDDDDYNNDDDDDRPPPLVRAGECHNPKVTWFDDRKLVYVYIHLANVQDYKITWTYRSLSVRTINEGKYYSADFTLYGVIDASKLQHSAKGFYVLIKMVKTQYGELWPRLMITDGNYDWIKRHADHIAEESDSCDDVASSTEEKTPMKYVPFNKDDFIMDPKPSGFYSDGENSSDSYEPEFNSYQRLRPVDPEDPFRMNNR